MWRNKIGRGLCSKYKVFDFAWSSVATDLMMPEAASLVAVETAPALDSRLCRTYGLAASIPSLAADAARESSGLAASTVDWTMGVAELSVCSWENLVEYSVDVHGAQCAM